jgi:hypothetical protein
LDLYDVVRRQRPLPHIDADLRKIDGERRDITVAMVLHKNAAAVAVIVQLLIAGLKHVAEDLRGEKELCFGARSSWLWNISKSRLSMSSLIASIFQSVYASKNSSHSSGTV